MTVGPVEALYRSAQLMSDTRGEEIVGSFSFGLLFFFLTFPGIALPFTLNGYLARRG
jgi:hypothetical protein